MQNLTAFSIKATWTIKELMQNAGKILEIFVILSKVEMFFFSMILYTECAIIFNEVKLEFIKDEF